MIKVRGQIMSIEKFLKNIPLFSSLSNETIIDICSALESRNLEPGEILFNQGDPGAEMILVIEGVVSIFAPMGDNKGNEKPIRTFLSGDILGEMALIDQKPRSLSARAEEHTKILALGYLKFKKLISENPEMAFSVMVGLNDRIRYTTDFLNEVRHWVEHVTQGDYQTTDMSEKSDQYKDDSMSTLAAEFAQMAARVQEREDELRKQVYELRIAIDETKRKKDVEEIIESDYYRNLKKQAKSMRREKKE